MVYTNDCNQHKHWWHIKHQDIILPRNITLGKYVNKYYPSIYCIIIIHNERWWVTMNQDLWNYSYVLGKWGVTIFWQFLGNCHGLPSHLNFVDLSRNYMFLYQENKHEIQLMFHAYFDQNMFYTEPYGRIPMNHYWINIRYVGYSTWYRIQSSTYGDQSSLVLTRNHHGIICHHAFNLHWRMRLHIHGLPFWEIHDSIWRYVYIFMLLVQNYAYIYRFK